MLEVADHRPLKRLFDQRAAHLAELRSAYEQHAPPDEPDDMEHSGITEIGPGGRP